MRARVRAAYEQAHAAAERLRDENVELRGQVEELARRVAAAEDRLRGRDIAVRKAHAYMVRADRRIADLVHKLNSITYYRGIPEGIQEP